VPENQGVMAAPTSPAGRRPRLGDRLAVARRRRFVGRAAELSLFGSALAEAEPPFALLYVHGPGGVGKTLLLGEFARLATDAGVPVMRLDGRDLDPSPAGFLAALGWALDEPPDRSPLEALALRPRAVLMVDTYETLAPLDAWLRETLLPELPGGHLVVLAGRDPPAAGWLADAGWRDLARVVPLRNLRPSESRAYLAARGVPAAQHPAALSFTHGHPLALSLVADVSASGGDPTAFAPEQHPDVVRSLLERFVQRLPGPRHREALEACAHVRVTTEALLASALDAEDAHELFGWLRRLSFVEEGPDRRHPPGAAALRRPGAGRQSQGRAAVPGADPHLLRAGGHPGAGRGTPRPALQHLPLPAGRWHPAGHRAAVAPRAPRRRLTVSGSDSAAFRLAG
jgi:hypothetical protein